MFSESELLVSSNIGFILTKNRVFEKVYNQFGEISNRLLDNLKPLNNKLPQVFKWAPKISKGEQYGNLPWAMLDYPRYFNKENGHFAVRIFFWWGEGYTIQAQFSGNFIQPVIDGLHNPDSIQKLKSNAWYAGYVQNPWIHELIDPDMISIESTIPDFKAESSTFFKLVSKYELSQYKELAQSVSVLSQFMNDCFGGN